MSKVKINSSSTLGPLQRMTNRQMQDTATIVPKGIALIRNCMTRRVFSTLCLNINIRSSLIFSLSSTVWQEFLWTTTTSPMQLRSTHASHTTNRQTIQWKLNVNILTWRRDSRWRWSWRGRPCHRRGWEGGKPTSTSVGSKPVWEIHMRDPLQHLQGLFIYNPML